MAELVEFPIDGGGMVLVATTGHHLDEPVFRGGSQRDLVTRSSQTIHAAIAQLKPAAQAVVDTFIDLPRRPDEMSVTFGVELTAAAGAIIASTAASANFSVTISWKATTADPRR